MKASLILSLAAAITAVAAAPAASATAAEDGVSPVVARQLHDLFGRDIIKWCMPQNGIACWYMKTNDADLDVHCTWKQCMFNCNCDKKWNGMELLRRDCEKKDNYNGCIKI